MRLRFLSAAAGSLVLACCVVYAASVSVQAPFSVQVQSSSGVPAPALAAGFTTPVILSDFTSSAYANASTWLDCAGASNPIWYQGWNGLQIGSDMPCPTITSDGAGNPQVLEIMVPPLSLSFLQNSFGCQCDFNGIKLYNPVAAKGIEAPTNSYWEAVFWMASLPFNAYMQGPWQGSTSDQIPSGSGNLIEFDAFEVTGSVSTAGVGNYYTGNGCGGQCGVVANWFNTSTVPNPPPGFTSGPGAWLSSGYHKVSQRTTSDGTTLYRCLWLDDVFQNCVSFGDGAGGISASYQFSDAHSREETFISLAGANYVNGGTTTNTIGYLKSFFMWSCANWQATACKTSSADPGGY